MIEQTINLRPEQMNVPATAKQRNFIKVLVASNLLPAMPYKEWVGLTANQASNLISSVPEEKRQTLREQNIKEKLTKKQDSRER